MVDTSVLVAGVSGFKAHVRPKTKSATLIRDWLEHDIFAWLVTRDILTSTRPSWPDSTFAPADGRPLPELLENVAPTDQLVVTIAV